MKKSSLFQTIFRSKFLIIMLIATLFFLIVSIIALRDNYATMTELRQAVAVADEQNGDVETALQDLREHVHGHMNTNLASGANPIKPPIQLKFRYDRLMAQERERVKAANATITAQAESVCSQQFPGSGINSARVSCITDYVAANAVTENAVAEDLYKFDFVSPRWSPDLAGFALVATALSGIVFIGGVLYTILKRRS